MTQSMTDTKLPTSDYAAARVQMPNELLKRTSNTFLLPTRADIR